MIKTIGPTAILERHRAICHCGSVKLEKGGEFLKLYQFNTHVARHYFCANCSIYTHHRRRSNPEQYGYNVGCLVGVNPFDLGPVPTSGGVNHLSDRQTLAAEANSCASCDV